MSYELRNGETLGHAARRICRREIERAIKWSQRPEDGEQSPVHQTRKHLKKARAALRLLSPVLGREKFAFVEKKLRKMGKLLSAMCWMRRKACWGSSLRAFLPLLVIGRAKSSSACGVF